MTTEVKVPFATATFTGRDGLIVLPAAAVVITASGAGAAELGVGELVDGAPLVGDDDPLVDADGELPWALLLLDVQPDSTRTATAPVATTLQRATAAARKRP
jgi:hypothetical protein